ncbi:hypothetical protein MKX01_021456 [Papaver californicum]|nr:hypothetical protein MKX01_021456 [Papaver californicum]
MGNSCEDEIRGEQAYEFITQNLKKKPSILTPKMREMLQVTLILLHTRCNELSGLQRDLQDHIAICEDICKQCQMKMVIWQKRSKGF